MISHLIITSIRIVVSLGLLLYAMIFISGTMNDWSESPLQIVIETTNHPVESVPFPAITVCPGQDNKIMDFGFVETFLNLIRLQCDQAKVGDCEATAAARRDFAFLLDLLEADLRKALKRSGNCSDFGLPVFVNTDIRDWIVDDFLNGNGSLARKVVGDYEKFYNTSRIGQADIYNFQSNMRTDISEKFGKESMEFFEAMQNKGKCTSEKNTTESCGSMIKRWDKIVCSSNVLFSLLPLPGTLLRTFVGHLKIYAALNRGTYDLDADPDKAANRLFTKMLRKILGSYNSTGSNVTISLLDVARIVSRVPSDSDNIIYSFAGPFQTSLALSLGTPMDSLNNFRYNVAWENFLKGVASKNYSHPCTLTEFQWYCRAFTQVLQRNMLETMKILRFSQPQFTSVPDFVSMYNSSLAFLGEYNLTNLKSVMSPWRPLVPFCGSSAVGGKFMQVDFNCVQFEPTWTDSGICGTYNALPFHKAFDQSVPANDMFKKVYGMGDAKKTIHNISGSGKVFSFTSVLDAHQVDSYYLGAYDLTPGTLNNATFEVSIGSFLNFFKVKAGNSITVSAGQKVNLRVVPSELVAEANIRDIPIERRKCRLQDETDGLNTIFNYYTQSTCKFECYLKKTADYCRCVPANYPNVADSPLCDYMGSSCFSQMMQNGNGRFNQADCGCLPDCQQVSYLYSLAVEDMDIDVACNRDPVNRMHTYIAEQRGDDYSKSMDSTYAETVERKTMLDDAAFCKLKVLTDIAVINVEIATDTIIRSRNQQKSTFEEKLAYVGGTIGLFNGMSFITLVDILLIAVEYLGRKKVQTKKAKTNITISGIKKPNINK